MKTKAKTSMCLHLIVKETLYYSHHGLHLPKLFPWMPVRKSGTSIPRGKFLVSVSSRELKALSWVMRVSHSCRCFAQGRNPNLFDKGKNRLKKNRSISMSGTPV